MGLSGQLGTFSLLDLIQLVSMAGQSGRLTLHTDERHGGMSFFHGRIFSAWASDAPRIGSLLLADGLLDDQALTRALEIQAEERKPRPLGKILLENEAVSPDELYAAVEQHIKRTISDLTLWSDARFEFADHTGPPPLDDTGLLPSEAIPHFHLDTQALLLDAMRIYDERARHDPESAPRDEEEAGVFEWEERAPEKQEQQVLSAAALCHQLIHEPDQLASAIVACAYTLSGGRPAFLYRYRHTEDVMLREATYPRNPSGIAVDLRLTAQDLPLYASQLNRDEWPPRLTGALRDCFGELPASLFPIDLGGSPYGLLVTLDRPTRTTPVSMEMMGYFARHAEVALGNAYIHERTTRLQLTDALTGVYNHRAFQARLFSEIARSQRHGHKLSVMILDIDAFKALLDRRGRRATDEVLAELADLLRQALRASDVIGRLSKNEFAVLLPETEQTGALTKAERLRDAIAAHHFSNVDSGILRVSVGISLFPMHAGDSHGLVGVARQAVHAAQSQGGDRILVAPDTPPET